MKALNIVELSKRAQKDLAKIPEHIKTKLLVWIDSVEQLGVYQVRKIPGYHDEPLKGNRLGQRFVRLSKGYRAIYTMTSNGSMELIIVEEVNKHDY
ncbi:addiction module toxin, RelE/StbE family [Legionella busanensis]|uniref:Addiction module toxin, RelE/StbE family n=1 Tax=Legionella busanensis TaxID=190655 RepID=A0A378KB71_9GAMM|nr:type II toxin-antitoxin system mRNA interferase toxin, RelE/StbE family [Legionella busanensis]STX81423.1 addiction module toxin, RelE/StbE family [Legionella busanensis]